MNSTNEMPMKQMIESALSKIREVVDVNTVIGEPIILPGEVSVIPFSKVSVGFASGGSEFGGKTPSPDGKSYFAGGNGAGVTMTPIGFIVVEQGKVRIIEIGNDATYQAPKDPINRVFDGVNGVIDKTPDLLSKIAGIFGRHGEESDAAEVDVEELLSEEENDEDVLRF